MDKKTAEALARVIDQPSADARRLDWLERHHTLHTEIEITYVVDGYEVEVVDESGRALSESHHGKTLRAAIDLAMAESSEPT